LALIIAALGSPRTAKIKHQSQTGEVLSDVGQNESKIKRNKFPAGLDKVVGFIEAQGFSPGNDTHKEIALKGRPNGIDYNVYICCYMQWLSPFHI
jgi:hypothetical protein